MYLTSRSVVIIMNPTRKKISKYLVEIKKVKGKFSFFPDLFAVVNKKKGKKLSEKLNSLQDIMSNTSYGENEYKKKLQEELKKFNKDEIPENIFKVINNITNDLNKENNENEDNKSKINSNDNEKEKIADFSKVLDITKCLKNILKNIKNLKRHKSWFFQKDNSAKIISKLATEIIESIQKNIKEKNNEININNIYSDLMAIKDYISEALKLRIIEKSLHDDEEDDVKYILINLYNSFGYLNKLIFHKEFEELNQTFDTLIGDKSKPENFEYIKKYYINLINKDIKKLYKKTSSIFSKDNEAKKLYKELNILFKNLKSELKKSDNKKNIQENLIKSGESICKYAEERKTRLEKENRSTSKDLTLKIMYNLYKDYNKFINYFGGKLKELDMDEYFEVDEATKRKYYKMHFSTELSKLFKINELLTDFNKYSEINNLIEDMEVGQARKKLQEIFGNIIKCFSNFEEISFVDDSKKILTQEFDAWEKEFKNKVLLYRDFVISNRIFADFCKDENKKKKFSDARKKELENKIQKIDDKLANVRRIIKSPENKEKFLKDYEQKESKFKKINGKRFLKTNSAKILGTIVSSVSIMDLGKIIVTVESLKIAKFFSVGADIDSNYATLLAAEVNLDCKLFKIMSLGAVKIRVYASFCPLGIVKLIHEMFEPDSIVWSFINFNEIKKFEANLTVNNNLNSGSVYFFPYKSNIEKIQDNSDNVQDNTQINKNNNINAAQSIEILKEIKINIKSLNSSKFKKIFNSDNNKLIYEYLYKIYKNLSRTIKSVSGTENEIKDIITGAITFINQKIDSINTEIKNKKHKNKKEKDKKITESSKIIEKLQEISNDLKKLAEYLISDEYYYDNNKQNKIDSKKFIESVGSINIYGEILASVPFIQEEQKILKEISDEKSKAQGISSSTQVTKNVAGKNNPGYVIVTIENATAKGVMPEHDFKFDENQIKNSIIACVADLTINADIDKFVSGQGLYKILNPLIKSSINNLKEKEKGIVNEILNNNFLKINDLVKYFTPKDYKKYVGDNLTTFSKTMQKGVRARVYLSVDGIAKKVANMIKVSQNIQKGKINFFK